MSSHSPNLPPEHRTPGETPNVQRHEVQQQLAAMKDRLLQAVAAEGEERTAKERMTAAVNDMEHLFLQLREHGQEDEVRTMFQEVFAFLTKQEALPEDADRYTADDLHRQFVYRDPERLFYKSYLTYAGTQEPPAENVPGTLLVQKAHMRSAEVHRREAQAALKRATEMEDVPQEEKDAAIANAQAELRAVVQECQTLQDRFEEAGDLGGLSSMLYEIGMVAELLGDYPLARATQQESAAVAEKQGKHVKALMGEGESYAVARKGNLETPQQLIAAITNLRERFEGWCETDGDARRWRMVTALELVHNAQKAGDERQEMQYLRMLVEDPWWSGEGKGSQADWLPEMQRRFAELQEKYAPKA